VSSKKRRTDTPAGAPAPAARIGAGGIAVRIAAVVFVVGFLVLSAVLPLQNNPTWSPPDTQDEKVPLTRLSLYEHIGTLVGTQVGLLLNAEAAGLEQRLVIGGYAAMCLFAALGLGWLLLRLMGLLATMTRGQSLVFGYGVGIAALGLVVLLLGLVGALWRWLFLCLFLPLAGLGVMGFIRLLRPREGIRRDAPLWRWNVWGVCLAVAAGAFVLYTLLASMTPPTAFDVLEYHMQGPKEFYQAGRIGFLSHNVYTSFPFGTEMLNLAGMVLADDVLYGALVGKTVLGSFFWFAAIGVWSMGRRFFTGRVGALAAALVLTIPWTYRLSLQAYAEGGLTFFTLATLYAVLLAVNSERPRRWFLLVGLLAGGAVAVKYTGLVFVAMPAGAIALAWRLPAKRSWRPDLRAAAAVVLGVVLVSGAWFTKNLVETGNPTYPLLYDVFGGRHWDPETNARWVRGHRSHDFSTEMAGQNVMDMVLQSDWGSPLVFMFVPLAFVAAKGRRNALAVGAYMLVFLVMWFYLTHRIDRFWVALMPMWALLSARGAMVFAEGWWTWLRRGAIVLCLAASAAVNACPALSPVNALLYRAEDVVEVGLKGPDLDSRKKYGRFRVQYYVNHLDGPVKVLMVGEAAVFYCTRPILYNTVFDTDELRPFLDGKTPSNFHEELRRQGVTHVLVNWKEIDRYNRPMSYGGFEFVKPEFFDKCDADWIRRHPNGAPPNSRPVLEPVFPVDPEDPEVWKKASQRVYRVKGTL